MNPILTILLAALALSLIILVLWWLIITTEGVYLGRRMVIWLYDIYARRYEGIKGYEAPIESRFLGRPLMKVLSPNTAPLVLDVATGTGRLPRALLREPNFEGSVIGIDLSRRMLHFGAGRLAEEMYYGRAHLMHAPAEQLPFADDLFDLVTCLEALEFMMRPKKVIAELVRLTRPGGWLLLTNRIGVDARLMPGKTWTPQQAIDIYRNEFGLLDVEIQTWQFDYDLVWARKGGESLAARKRPLEEIWHCPQCSQTKLVREDGGYICENCKRRVPVGKDGVIELV